LSPSVSSVPQAAPVPVLKSPWASCTTTKERETPYKYPLLDGIAEYWSRQQR